MPQNSSIQLAKFFIALQEMQDRINNEILPLAGHLRADDDGELANGLQIASESIAQYLNRFKLQATDVRQ